MSCPFCDLLIAREREFIFESPTWFAFTPIGPVNDRHTLLVPKRHVERLENLSRAEWSQLFDALDPLLTADYNIGVSAGKLAGQTVFHLHIHVIPREAGDVESVKGGIVGALGEKIKGSKMSEYLSTVKD